MASDEGTSSALLAVAGVGAAVLGAGIYACLSMGKGKGVKLPVNKSEIPPGSMKEVKVSDTLTVLVVHTVDGHVYATGHKCPHYDAPLAKGVLNGNRVVCPWHAACFDVSTGDIEDGPVLNALPSYSIIVESNGDLFIRVPEAPTKYRQPKFCKSNEGDRRHFVFVGAGAANAAAIETVRSNGFAGKITLIGKEKVLPYDRPKLSKAMSMETAKILLRKKEFYDELGVDVKLGVSVTEIRGGAHEVVLSTGETLKFDKLLVATGGAPRRFAAPEPLVTPGSTLRNIFPLRDGEHGEAIEALVNAIGPDDPIVVLGSSFIGMEAAAYFAQSKGRTNITVLGMENVPFERVLGPEVGAYTQRLFESKKIQFRLGPDAVVTEFKGDTSGAVTAVQLKSGDVLPAKVVIIGAGIIPATDILARVEGVEVLARAPGGVKVNEYMQTGHPDVFAAGDIAYFPYHHSVEAASAFTRIEHWDVAYDQGRIAALNMLGKETPYRGVPFFWTGVFGRSLRYAGHCHKPTRTIIHGKTSEDKFVVYYIVGETVAAVATIGKDPYATAAMELMRIGRLPPVSVLASSTEFDLPAYLLEQTRDIAMGAPAR